ncbi:MAG: Ig-like domain-containing protein, partial [Granulicella sp.]
MMARKTLVPLALFVACFSGLLITGCGTNTSLPQLGIVAGSSTLSVGTSISLKAMVRSNTTNPGLDVTDQTKWSSSNAQAASVSASGLVTGVTTGSAVITANSSGLIASIALNVTVATVTGVALNPQGVSIPVGLTQQFTATASYTDKTTSDVTPSANWSVLPANVATIDTRGLLTALAPGGFTV